MQKKNSNSNWYIQENIGRQRTTFTQVDVLPLNNFKSNYMYLICWVGS